MQHAKPVSSPLDSHFRLCTKDCPHAEQEKEEMSSIPHSLAIGTSMYDIASTRPHIAHLVVVEVDISPQS